MDKDLEKKYGDRLLMAYDCGETYGVWLAPVTFVLLDKNTLEIVKSLNLSEAASIIEKSIPLLNIDDEEKVTTESYESV